MNLIEERADLLRARVQQCIGQENIAGFYTGLNAMLVAPELWRNILGDIEAVQKYSDLATTAKHALEQGSEYLRAEYKVICAETTPTNVD